MTRISQLWAGLPAEEKEIYEKKHTCRCYTCDRCRDRIGRRERRDAQQPPPAIATLPQPNGKLTNGHAAQPPALAKKRAVHELKSEEEKDEAVDDVEDEEEPDEEAPPKKKIKSGPALAPVAAPVHKKRKNKD
ncbi:unnamed protein product [Peniophora sp. CBMAI 1063]|nr:unnamed protein product [Peniophora sp. CBMAI 1063]